MIVLDGVYSFDDDATRFHSVKAPTSAAMQTLLIRSIRRTLNQLEPDGVLIQDTEQPYFDFSEADASEADASEAESTGRRPIQNRTNPTPIPNC